MRLSDPLGSYADRDEFQIGRMLVWVKYPLYMDRDVLLVKAEKVLPMLESDIPAIEVIATSTVGSPFPATVIGITIEPDGSASYSCTFFDGQYEGEFIEITRESDDKIVVRRA